MAKEYTPIYEFVAILEGSEERLVTHFEHKEFERLVSALEESEDKDLAFFGVDEAQGLETYFNLDRVLYINVLDFLGGIPAEKETELSEEESVRILEKRLESDKTVLMWVWTTAKKEPELHYEVSYEDWDRIRWVLENNDQRFIGFTDEDGERVMIPLKHVVAVQVCDEFYHGDDVLERFAEKYGKREKDPEPIEIPVTA
jgi:hypothetical protein